MAQAYRNDTAHVLAFKNDDDTLLSIVVHLALFGGIDSIPAPACLTRSADP